jgi:hypothetical protein
MQIQLKIELVQELLIFSDLHLDDAGHFQSLGSVSIP